MYKKTRTVKPYVVELAVLTKHPYTPLLCCLQSGTSEFKRSHFTYNENKDVFYYLTNFY